MDMTHMDHMQMEQQTGTSYLWLIVGAALLLISIAAYIWASRTRGKILSHMKRMSEQLFRRKAARSGSQRML